MPDRIAPEELEKIRTRLSSPPRLSGTTEQQEEVLRGVIEDGLALFAELDAMNEEFIDIANSLKGVGSCARESAQAFSEFSQSIAAQSHMTNKQRLLLDAIEREVHMVLGDQGAMNRTSGAVADILRFVLSHVEEIRKEERQR